MRLAKTLWCAGSTPRFAVTTGNNSARGFSLSPFGCTGGPSMTEKALVKACGVEFVIKNNNSTHRKRNC
jgi:hypothetical protein